MAVDLDLGVKVIGSKTIRERDGLAMSSRNVYLTAEQRRVAPVLFQAMKETARRLRAGEDVQAAQATAVKTIAAAGFTVDYFETRHAETLAPGRFDQGWTLANHGRRQIGTTRLIDNIAV